MARRAAYTKIKRSRFYQPDHVAGMGDRLFRGFQCLNKDCTAFILVPDEDVTPDFSVECGTCGFRHAAGETTELYDYELVDERDGSLVESGAFEILHDDYLAEAHCFKYCIRCPIQKPKSSRSLPAVDSRAWGGSGCRLRVSC